MRCELVCDYEFEAAHRLPKVPPGHKCARMHGHSYHVQIAVGGEIDADQGWLIDFAEVTAAVAPVIEQVDHQVLNALEGLENPTCELLAVWLWRRIQPRLAVLEAITVAETRGSRCVYRGG